MVELLLSIEYIQKFHNEADVFIVICRDLENLKKRFYILMKI